MDIFEERGKAKEDRRFHMRVSKSQASFFPRWTGRFAKGGADVAIETLCIRGTLSSMATDSPND